MDNYARSQILQTRGFQSNTNTLTEAQIAEAKHRLWLDRPFYVQYVHWLHQVFVEHDLGTSLISRAPVLYLVGTRMLNSIILNLIELVFLTIISFALGIYFSSKAGSRIDPVVVFVSLFLNAFPGILLLILLQMFAATTGIFPVTAYPTEAFDGNPLGFTFSYVYHIILPCACKNRSLHSRPWFVRRARSSRSEPCPRQGYCRRGPCRARECCPTIGGLPQCAVISNAAWISGVLCVRKPTPSEKVMSVGKPWA